MSGDDIKIRFCDKCFALFANEGAKGRCPKDKRHHNPAGHEFLLPLSARDPDTAQRPWQRCEKCNIIFFNGEPDKGVCPVEGAHEATKLDPLVFVLSHDVNRTSSQQKAWEYCVKCKALYYDGYYPEKGYCAKSGVHERNGDAFRFLLEYLPGS
jgi:hypothetical protein